MSQRLVNVLRAGAGGVLAVVLAGGVRAQTGSPGQGGEILDLGRLRPATITTFAGHKAVTHPNQDAVMGFSVPTSVREILVRGGREVKKDDLLIRGDDAEQVAIHKMQLIRLESPLSVDRARAAMDQAKIEYERLKDAQAKNASGTQEVERARVGWEIATIDHQIAINAFEQEKVQLQRFQAMVDRYRLVAPFDGVVDAVNVNLGQAISENEKAIRVVDVDPLWIDVPSPTDDPTTLALKVGDRAWVLCDVAGQGKLAQATVIEAAPTVDPTSRTRRIRVELPNPPGPGRFLPGEPVWVRFRAPDVKALSVSAAERQDAGVASR